MSSHKRRPTRLILPILIIAIGLLFHVPSVAQGGWSLVAADGLTCARGTPYAFFNRPADAEKLLLYFQGGGMCWDEGSCAAGAGLFDEVVQGDEINAYQQGIFDAANPQNTLNNYSAVFVPYCTGDWHTGARDVTYADGNTLLHHGAANARAALNWAATQYPNARDVVVAGCSAGAYGAIYHAPAVTRLFPRARVVQFGDGGMGRVPTNWTGLETWGSTDHAPRNVPTVPADTFVQRLYASASRLAPRARFGTVTTFNDNVQIAYYERMGGSISEWVLSMESSLAALHRFTNFRSVVLPGGEHCLLETTRFYSEVVETAAGMLPFHEWFAAFSTGAPLENAYCTAC